MLGNDVVDLRDPDARPESFRARFDERVFSLDERYAIAQDANPLARRWAHWGAKEAAYKLAKRLDSTFVFSPGRLVANYSDSSDNSDDSDQRSHRMSDSHQRRGLLELPRALPQGIRMLALRSFETADRVHVIAVPVGSDWSAVESVVEPLGDERQDPSMAVRGMAIREISRSFGVAAERLAIGREGRIPTVEIDGFRTSHTLSLSHHGRWIAYAMRIRRDLQSEAGWPKGGSDALLRAARATCTR